jgi:hypothetical protein
MKFWNRTQTTSYTAYYIVIGDEIKAGPFFNVEAAFSAKAEFHPLGRHLLDIAKSEIEMTHLTKDIK